MAALFSSPGFLLMLMGLASSDRLGDFEYSYSVRREHLHQQEKTFAGYTNTYTEVGRGLDMAIYCK